MQRPTAQQPTATPPNTQWFMPSSEPPVQQFSQPYVQPVDDQALSDKLKADRAKIDSSYDHMRRVNPTVNQAFDSTGQPQLSNASSTTANPVNPAILELAHNDDLNVSTLARQANKAQHPQTPPDEVVISLR